MLMCAVFIGDYRVKEVLISFLSMILLEFPFLLVFLFCYQIICPIKKKINFIKLK